MVINYCQPNLLDNDSCRNDEDLHSDFTKCNQLSKRFAGDGKQARRPLLPIENSGRVNINNVYLYYTRVKSTLFETV
mgnify:CR=1 FL=1